jgi:hypothetical protein
MMPKKSKIEILKIEHEIGNKKFKYPPTNKPTAPVQARAETRSTTAAAPADRERRWWPTPPGRHGGMREW